MNKLPAFEIEVPYHTQLNNDRDWNSGPENECSYTCLAMYLRRLGFVGNGQGQFEDQIEKISEAIGYQRGEPQGMNHFLRTQYPIPGYEHVFKYRATWEEVDRSLLDGQPAIIHTWLTGSGHVVLYKGWDDNAYGGVGARIFHDPYGEWFPNGYDTNRSGEDVPYSYPLCKRLIGTDGDLWAHFLVKK